MIFFIKLAAGFSTIYHDASAVTEVAANDITKISFTPIVYCFTTISVCTNIC